MKFSLAFCSVMAGLSMLSCSDDKYYNEDDFHRIKKVDTHAHLHSANTAIAEQARDDNFLLIDVTLDNPEGIPLPKQFEYGVLQRSKYPEQVELISAFTLENWNSPSWTQEVIEKLRHEFAQGSIGIKIWKNIGMTYRDSAGNFIMIDNPRFDSVINFVIAEGKTVMGHLGEPKNCWLPVEQMTVTGDKEYFKEHPQYHMYLHPEFPSYDDQIDARDRFIERHPDMRFVGAHLGSLEWNVDELAKRLDKYPNMAVDMAERICHLQYQSLTDWQRVHDFFIKYQDRLVYGTDISIDDDTESAAAKERISKIWRDDWKYFTTNDKMTARQVEGEFRGMNLPKEVVDKIYYKNAIRWFGIKG